MTEGIDLPGPGGGRPVMGIQARGYTRPFIEAIEPPRPAIQA